MPEHCVMDGPKTKQIGMGLASALAFILPLQTPILVSTSLKCKILNTFVKQDLCELSLPSF